MAPPGTFERVAAGLYHSCAVHHDGPVECWGLDNTGEMHAAPDVPLVRIAAAYWSTCGLTADGEPHCWGCAGDRNSGQCLPPDGTYLSISTYGYHGCGVLEDRTAVCWGHEDAGQLTPGSGPFDRVESGRWCSCGVRTDGTADCWGSNTPQGSAGECIVP